MPKQSSAAGSEGADERAAELERGTVADSKEETSKAQQGDELKKLRQKFLVEHVADKRSAKDGCWLIVEAFLLGFDLFDTVVDLSVASEIPGSFGTWKFALFLACFQVCS